MRLEAIGDERIQDRERLGSEIRNPRSSTTDGLKPFIFPRV